MLAYQFETAPSIAKARSWTKRRAPSPGGDRRNHATRPLGHVAVVVANTIVAVGRAVLVGLALVLRRMTVGARSAARALAVGAVRRGSAVRRRARVRPSACPARAEPVLPALRVAAAGIERHTGVARGSFATRASRLSAAVGVRVASVVGANRLGRRRRRSCEEGGRNGSYPTSVRIQSVLHATPLDPILAFCI